VVIFVFFYENFKQETYTDIQEEEKEKKNVELIAKD